MLAVMRTKQVQICSRKSRYSTTIHQKSVQSSARQSLGATGILPCNMESTATVAIHSNTRQRNQKRIVGQHVPGTNPRSVVDHIETAFTDSQT